MRVKKKKLQNASVAYKELQGQIQILNLIQIIFCWTERKSLKND